VQPSVEATLGDRLLDVTVLVQKRAARLEVAGEEGAGYKRYGHHLGGRQPDLWVVAVAYCLQEFLAQVVGGYGIFQCVLPIQREGFRRPSDREDIVYWDRGQLGLTLLSLRQELPRWAVFTEVPSRKGCSPKLTPLSL
jgi:hypothetical protein